VTWGSCKLPGAHQIELVSGIRAGSR